MAARNARHGRNAQRGDSRDGAGAPLAKARGSRPRTRDVSRRSTLDRRHARPGTLHGGNRGAPRRADVSLRRAGRPPHRHSRRRRFDGARDLPVRPHARRQSVAAAFDRVRDRSAPPGVSAERRARDRGNGRDRRTRSARTVRGRNFATASTVSRPTRPTPSKAPRCSCAAASSFWSAAAATACFRSAIPRRPIA